MLLEGYPSGQRGQTVNLLAPPTEVRILPSPPDFLFIYGYLGGRRDIKKVKYNVGWCCFLTECHDIGNLRVVIR